MRIIGSKTKFHADKCCVSNWAFKFVVYVLLYPTYDIVTTYVHDRMEHGGETVIAEEVLGPGQAASAYDVLVGSSNEEVQPQSGDYSEGLLQGYPSDTTPAQPPLVPLLHVPFPAVTNVNVQNAPGVVGYSEGLNHAYTTSLTLAQPVPTLPHHHHHHDPPEPTLSPQNIQVQPEDVEYWKGFPQVYPPNASSPQPAPAQDVLTFPTWPEQNINTQAQTEPYSEGLSQTHKRNSTHPAPPFPAPLYPPHQHLAFPSWPEQNVQVQQSEGYQDGALRPPASYTLTIPSMYHGPHCQDDTMLQNHVLSMGYPYEGQVRKTWVSGTLVRDKKLIFKN